DGSYPACQLLVEGDSVTGTTKYLYGTTHNGGANNVGTLYRITPTGSSFTKLKDFVAATGSQAYFNGPMVMISGVIYGVSYAGGAYNHGAIWKYDTATSTYSLLFSFNNSLAPPNQQGYLPQGGLSTDGAGNLYGTTRAGGSSNMGVIFKYTPSTN